MNRPAKPVPVVVDGAPQQPQVSPEPSGSTSSGTENCFTLRTLRKRAEIQAIQQALGYAGWNRTRAARLLEISYRSLLLKIQRHKITRESH